MTKRILNVIRNDFAFSKMHYRVWLAIPKGLYKSMDIGTQYYTYTTLGVKYFDEEMAEIFLKIGGMIENEGYDACLKKLYQTSGLRG